MSYLFKNNLRRKLKSQTTAFGLWVTLESATVTELAAEMGLDWVCLDLEHGSLSYRDVVDHLRAAKGSDLTVLVRLPTTAVDTVKRSLDLGAHGVLLPLIRTAEDLQAGFEHARYPLLGKRGLGGERAIRWGLALEHYVGVADEEVMVIPVIETAAASANIADILAVPGLEAIFFGPADLSQSCGYRAVWEGPGVAADIVRMTHLALARNIAVGVIGMGDPDIALRQSQGFKMIALGTDVGLLTGRLRGMLQTLTGQAVASGWD